MTIDSWYKVPIRPRIAAGETSDTYIGARIDAPPTASPPRNLAMMNHAKLGASPVPTDVSRNSSATHSRMPRRPNVSVSRPAIADPSTHPNSSELNAHPRLRSVR